MIHTLSHKRSCTGKQYNADHHSLPPLPPAHTLTAVSRLSRERSSPLDLGWLLPLHAEGECTRDLLIRSASRTGLQLQGLLQLDLGAWECGNGRMGMGEWEWENENVDMGEWECGNGRMGMWEWECVLKTVDSLVCCLSSPAWLASSPPGTQIWWQRGQGLWR